MTWSVEGARRPTLVLAVKQTQPDAWGLFRVGHVDVALLDSAGAITGRVQANVDALRDQVIRLTVPTSPAGIRLDPEGVMLLSAEVHR